MTGIRHDPFAEAHPLTAEVENPKAEQGYYLHPRLYGRPQTQGIAWAEAHRQALPAGAQKSRRKAWNSPPATPAARRMARGRSASVASFAPSQDAKLAALGRRNRKLASEVAQLQKSQAQMMAVVERLEHQSPKPTRLARLRF